MSARPLEPGSQLRIPTIQEFLRSGGNPSKLSDIANTVNDVAGVINSTQNLLNTTFQSQQNQQNQQER